MQYIEIFFPKQKLEISLKNFDTVLIFAQNIDRRYALEPPRRGGSNEYPHSLFWSKHKKISRNTPANPIVTIGARRAFWLICDTY